MAINSFSQITSKIHPKYLCMWRIYRYIYIYSTVVLIDYKRHAFDGHILLCSRFSPSIYDISFSSDKKTYPSILRSQAPSELILSDPGRVGWFSYYIYIWGLAILLAWVKTRRRVLVLDLETYRKVVWHWFFRFWALLRFAGWRVWVQHFVELLPPILFGNQSCRKIIRFLPTEYSSSLMMMRPRIRTLLLSLRRKYLLDCVLLTALTAIPRYVVSVCTAPFFFFFLFNVCLYLEGVWTPACFDGRNFGLPKMEAKFVLQYLGKDWKLQE